MERCPIKIVIYDPTNKGRVAADMIVAAVVYQRSDGLRYIRAAGIGLRVTLHGHGFMLRLSRRQAIAYFMPPTEAEGRLSYV